MQEGKQQGTDVEVIVIVDGILIFAVPRTVIHTTFAFGQAHVTPFIMSGLLPGLAGFLRLGRGILVLWVPVFANLVGTLILALQGLGIRR